MKLPSLYLVAVMLFSSCAPEASPGTSHASGSLTVAPARVIQAAEVNWTAGTLSGAPDLYVNVFGKSRKLGSAENNEGEVHQNMLQAGQGGVPANAISGFGIDGADGESEVYYAKQSGSAVVIYHRIWNPYPDDGPTGWRSPRPVTTITP